MRYRTDSYMDIKVCQGHVHGYDMGHKEGQMCSNKRHFLPQLNNQTVVPSPSSLSHSSLTAAFTKSVNTSEKSHHRSEKVFHLTLFHTVLKTVEFVLIVISTSLRHIAPSLVAEQHPYIHLLFLSSPFPFSPSLRSLS